MQSSENKKFGAGDIERYHKGLMQPEERHALEKAALDDPFLADALEGYAYSSQAQPELEQIRTRLQERTQERKVVPLLQRHGWLKVAAVLVLAAGGGWLFFRSFTMHDTGNAYAKTDSSVDSVQNVSPVTQDSIASSSVASPVAAADTVGQQETVAKKGRPSPTSTTNGTSSVTTYYNTSPAREANNFSAMHFSTPRADSASIARALNGRVEGTSVTAESDTNLHIVMKPLPGNDVEHVTVMSAKRARPTEADRLRHVVIDTLEPAEGWAKYDDYLTAHLQMPDEIAQKPERGEVELSFDVNKQGDAVNITVVRSLCASCDEEAVRLLKEGPKWKKKKNRKGKVTIRF